MSVLAKRTQTIVFSGDLDETRDIPAANNGSSPAEEIVTTLLSGANTITAPASGTTPTALTIIPPVGNTQTITLKGVTGDTGVALHPTDPTVIALAATFTTLVLTAGGGIAGVRLIWS